MNIRKVRSLLFLFFMLSIVGCGSSPTVTEYEQGDNSTLIGAAKMFTQAQIEGDAEVMEYINHSSPLDYPPQHVLSQASEAGYYKYDINDFSFEPVNDTTVNVRGQVGDYSLTFIIEKGKYYFDTKRVLYETTNTKRTRTETANTKTEVTSGSKESNPTPQVEYVEYDIEGEWKGVYTASQGEMSLVLNVDKTGDHQYEAVFNFGPTDNNPDVLQGSFLMKGHYDPSAQSLEFKGIKWIDQPINYIMADMVGTIDVKNNMYKGDLPNIGRFWLTKNPIKH